MRNHFRLVIAGLILLATVAVPELGALTLGASSGAGGVLLISLFYLFLFMAYYSLHPSHSFGISAISAFLVAAVVLIQGVVSWLINYDFNFVRFWQSELLLILVILGGLSLTRLVLRLPYAQADFAVRAVFTALLLSGLVGIFGYAPFSGDRFWKSVLFFGEPSSFALSFLPFLLYMIVLSRWRMKVFFLLTSFLLAVLLENLTFVVGLALAVVLIIPLRRLLVIVPFAALLFATVDLDSASNFVDLVYYIERADLSRENQNLSTLAFMQGWERAYLNLEESFGLGVGFQQFGIVGSRGEILEDIMKLNEGEELNLLDGGSVASKFIGEFGVLGVVMLIVYLAYLAKSIRLLREASASSAAPRDSKQIFFLACFAMFSIDLFVRGGGYFSSSGFLFIASVLWMAYGQPLSIPGRASVCGSEPQPSG